LFLDLLLGLHDTPDEAIAGPLVLMKSTVLCSIAGFAGTLCITEPNNALANTLTLVSLFLAIKK
jgi:hypothetical protein|tara:strand:+ start:594 stop:785 length:192 start_codon:yes stop_codon:yes gene_type:complete